MEEDKKSKADRKVKAGDLREWVAAAAQIIPTLYLLTQLIGWRR